MMIKGCVLPVIEERPRTEIETADVPPPGADWILTPAALPYRPVAKVVPPVLVNSSEETVLTA